MTFNQFYVRMGEYNLYDLRDELVEWMRENNYHLRDEITEEISNKMPDKFINETYKKMQEVKEYIYKQLLGDKQNEKSIKD